MALGQFECPSLSTSPLSRTTGNPVVGLPLGWIGIVGWSDNDTKNKKRMGILGVGSDKEEPAGRPAG